MIAPKQEKKAKIEVKVAETRGAQGIKKLGAVGEHAEIIMD